MPNPSDRLTFVKVQAKDGQFLGKNTNKILVFVIDDNLGECGGSKPPFWKKIAHGEGAEKKVKNT